VALVDATVGGSPTKHKGSGNVYIYIYIYIYIHVLSYNIISGKMDEKAKEILGRAGTSAVFHVATRDTPKV